VNVNVALPIGAFHVQASPLTIAEMAAVSFMIADAVKAKLPIANAIKTAPRF